LAQQRDRPADQVFGLFIGGCGVERHNAGERAHLMALPKLLVGNIPLGDDGIL
jgi:hypothetical protein